MEEPAAGLIKEVFSINSRDVFEKTALRVFHFQAANNEIYHRYLHFLKIDPGRIHSYNQIPFLPIEVFRQHDVRAFREQPEMIFSSSSTTESMASHHAVKSLNVYDQSFLQCFGLFYGDPSQYCILALLPSYLERKGSSLVYMTEQLIRKSGRPKSGFYLYNLRELSEVLSVLEKSPQKTILIGVSFALLDLAEKFPQQLRNTIVMETGGMKGRRKEITREELHEKLKKSFGINTVHSEYGMTELLSQAYSNGGGIFRTPPWMKILIRESHDPFSQAEPGKAGGINVIDLANLYTCSFIETSDIGKINEDGSFEVLGRFDQSELRGCNLMVE